MSDTETMFGYGPNEPYEQRLFTLRGANAMACYIAAEVIKGRDITKLLGEIADAQSAEEEKL